MNTTQSGIRSMLGRPWARERDRGPTRTILTDWADGEREALGCRAGMADGGDQRDLPAGRSQSGAARLPGFTPDVAKNVMAHACKAAKVAHYHPHDLRHRYASVKIAEGVPVTQLAAQLGHSKKSLTLDVYSHVLIDERVTPRV